jgi:phosphoribosyl 1,2-cyclic phosphodiesterase
VSRILVLTFSLQSGSNGNAIYVEADGVKLLFDAGISGRRAEQRANHHQRTLYDLDAVLISHDHRDHAAGAGIYQRRYRVPIFVTEPTYRAVRGDWGPVHDVRHFRPGDTLQFEGVLVHTVPTPHDAADGVAFVVEHQGSRLGILTDLGHPFGGLADLMATLDAAYLESNYDPQMLAAGPYPEFLKQRIAGTGGHLSNGECVALALPHVDSKLKWLAIAHLSEQNNEPELALRQHRAAYGSDFPVHLAPRHATSDMLVV